MYEKEDFIDLRNSYQNALEQLPLGDPNRGEISDVLIHLLSVINTYDQIEKECQWLKKHNVI